MSQVSVVVPLYNKRAYIGETIASVLASTHASVEVVVVDDGSTDGGAEIVAAVNDPRVRLVQQANAGASAARNRGFAEARGEFFVFLDADDLLFPDALGRFLRHFETFPGHAAVYGDYITLDQYGRELVSSRPHLRRTELNVHHVLHTWNGIGSAGAVCIRRRMLKALRGFREEIKFSEEWDLWARIAATGTFGFLGPGPVLKYRVLNDSMSRTTSLEERVRNVQMIFSSRELNAALTSSELANYRDFAVARFYFMQGYIKLGERSWAEARTALRRSIKERYISWRQPVLLAFAISEWLPHRLQAHLERP